MAADHYEQIGLEYYRQVDKLLVRLLLVGILLLLSHMLRISPSEFDAAGAKIAIKDPVIIRGALALVYLHYVWMSVISSSMSNSFIVLKLSTRSLRASLRKAYAPYKDTNTKRMTTRTPRQAKRVVRWQKFFFNLFLAPYAIVMFLLLVGAFLVALADIYSFGAYLWSKQWDLAVPGLGNFDDLFN